jgi:hypothetical protein
MNKIRQFIECFVTVTTGILIIAALTFPSTPEALVPATLWQILLCAGLCSLVTVVFFPDENASKLRIWAGIALHFISLCAIMICCGRWFGWVGPGIGHALIMIGEVFLVYAFTTGTTCIMEKRQAAEMNDQLRKNYPSESPQEK